ncbi:MAG: TonB-dependent receptor, partial [Daejeonella sp.]|nr:TonB-dependent receptor [Daejeonella sp.]
MRLFILSIILFGFVLTAKAQTSALIGLVKSGQNPVAFASIKVLNSKIGTTSDSLGKYSISRLSAGKYVLSFSALGYSPYKKELIIRENETVNLDVELEESGSAIEEFVVTGTMKEVSRLASPVPVEVYSPAFFRKNPTPSVFDALQNVNGVRPQLNCNICNTGDIHINGLEGPYTMILIDGMPIVSGLSSVYCLSGIPNALIERVEIVKGPASSLYGSEAV